MGSDLGTKVRPEMALMSSSTHIDIGGKEGSSCCDNSKGSHGAVLMFLKKYQKKPHQCDADLQPPAQRATNTKHKVWVTGTPERGDSSLELFLVNKTVSKLIKS